MNFELSRRQFLRTLTLAGAASLLPLAPGAVAGGSYVPVGKAADFAAGDFKKVVLPDGRSLYVGRAGGGKDAFLALSALCTHKGCEVLWAPDDHQFQCPCHGGKFDDAGRNVAGPPRRPLPSLPTKVQGDEVMVQV